ncbi:hypothetical protein KPH14_000953 [Odynerus spinipes]|uniref:Integrase catalytic domain-containing protein n=1 Tax=Odynerus spinipes TaxID=1348599 RepID=A0AAD9REP4_9HYME|nr:hypothetical protein KPH14_000953 [Odynerus spinipes]
MADLPKSRITPSCPLALCGVDYSGPIILRASKGRGHKTIKAYIAIFVCFSTRAAHIELVSDYSSEIFLAALRRFISRRGIPNHIYSDNDTTFQGADKEIRRAFHQVTRDPSLTSEIYIASDSINWFFIPPAAPHVGGIW